VREKGSNSKMKPWESPFILMVDRGGCTFVKQVRNAQQAGAAGVVIAGNTCLCSDQECIHNSIVKTCETTETAGVVILASPAF